MFAIAKVAVPQHSPLTFIINLLLLLLALLYFLRRRKRHLNLCPTTSRKHPQRCPRQTSTTKMRTCWRAFLGTGGRRGEGTTPDGARSAREFV